jgi:hypothetical protein
MSGYLKQKLFQALHDLVGAGDLDQRLTHAGNYLAHVQDHEVPEEDRKELGEIKAIMFATPLSSERGYSARQISTEDGTKHIESSSSTPRSWVGSKQAIRRLLELGLKVKK